MSRHGYILMHRKLMDSFVFQDPYHLKLWTYCLMKAAYQETEVKIGENHLRLAPGEFVWGRKSATEELNQGMKKSDQKLGGSWDHYLKIMERKGMIKRRSYHRYTIVSVVNYGQYQNKKMIVVQDPAAKIQSQSPAELPSVEAADNPYTMYQRAYAQPLTAVITQSITEWTNNFAGKREIVAYAIQLAGENAATSPRYFEAILRTWKKQGVKDLAEAQAFTKEFEAAKERKITEQLERREEEKQFARTPKEQLPTLSLHNWLAEERAE